MKTDKAIGSESGRQGTDDTTNNVVGMATTELQSGSVIFTTAGSEVWSYKVGRYPKLTIFTTEDGDVLTIEADVEEGTQYTATVEIEVSSTDSKEMTVKNLDDNTDGIIEIPQTITVGGDTYMVTVIKANAFKNATKLEGVVVPSTVTQIGANAYDGCTSLTSITFESSTLPTIGADALPASITTVAFPAEAYSNYDTALQDKGYTTDVYQPTVIMKDNAWGTIYSSKSYKLPSDLEAYIVVGIDYLSQRVQIMQEDGIQANVPMILHKKSTDQRYAMTLDNSFEIVNSGERSTIFKGATTSQTIANNDASQAYILYNNAFVKAANGTLPAYRCYLQQNSSLFMGNPSASRLAIELIDGSATKSVQQTSWKKSAVSGTHPAD